MENWNLSERGNRTQKWKIEISLKCKSETYQTWKIVISQKWTIEISQKWKMETSYGKLKYAKNGKLKSLRNGKLKSLRHEKIEISQKIKSKSIRKPTNSHTQKLIDMKTTTCIHAAPAYWIQIVERRLDSDVSKVSVSAWLSTHAHDMENAGKLFFCSPNLSSEISDLLTRSIVQKEDAPGKKSMRLLEALIEAFIRSPTCREDHSTNNYWTG